MPSPSTAWPPESGLWVAILMVPLDWASATEVTGSTSAKAAIEVMTRRSRGILIDSSSL